MKYILLCPVKMFKSSIIAEILAKIMQYESTRI